MTQDISNNRVAVKALLYQIVANEDTGIDVDKWECFTRDGEERSSLKVLMQPR